MTRQQSSGFSIGEVARRSGVKIETIRFYERSGLLAPPPRTSGGHRVYSHAEAQRLNFIRRARQLGFPLDQVRALLALADQREASCIEVERLARDHLAEVRGRIDDLARMDAVLSDLVTRCGQGETPDCAILEALFDGRGGHRSESSSLRPRAADRSAKSMRGA